MQMGLKSPTLPDTMKSFVDEQVSQRGCSKPISKAKGRRLSMRKIRVRRPDSLHCMTKALVCRRSMLRVQFFVNPFGGAPHPPQHHGHHRTGQHFGVHRQA